MYKEEKRKTENILILIPYQHYCKGSAYIISFSDKH
jgi:hypothetical protein